MLVDVRLANVACSRVVMLMMRIVRVRMAVHQWLVYVLMLVIFGEMQPNSDGHAGGRHPKRPADGLSVEQDGDTAADEGRRSEIGARAGRAQMAKCEDKQHQAHAVTEESEHE